MKRTAPAQSEELANSLAREIEGELHFDPYQRALYSTDASLYEILPTGIVIPKHAADVRAAVRIAAEAGVPIVPRGAGTSLSGQSIGAGLVLDFSKYMNRIVELDPQSRTARVEPGVVLDHLNAAASRHRLQFGPDVATSSRANLGGMIGNNSAGARSIWYGKTVDHVLELEAILADGSPVSFAPRTAGEWQRRMTLPTREGQIHREVDRLATELADEIVARYPAILRRVSGYNLDQFVPAARDRIPLPDAVREIHERQRARYGDAPHNLATLIVGAEGTLACVTEALVHLVPLPTSRGMLVLEFDTLAAAIESVGTILAHGPSAVELFDKLILELASRSLEYRHYLDFVAGRPESLLLVEFSADSPDEVERKLDALSRALDGHAGLAHQLKAVDRTLCDHIWACRKAALPLLMGIPGARKPIAFVEDTAVDPVRLPEFVARFREILDRRGTAGSFYGHASVGCLHIRPMIDTQNRDDLQRFEQIMGDVSDLVLEFGGAMSGEHGDGLARSHLNEKLFGPRIYRAFQELKAAFDPASLMNPGKIVDGPRPTDNLRHPPHQRPLEVPTTLDFSTQGGLAAAAALCNGAGVCRKTHTGTMCPSFMATLDEEHSTRGRANALRLVLSGVLPPEELTGDRLYRTYDLCLACKGCKAECPSNVDVAKLKGEFLDHYYRRHGTPLGVRAMAEVARMNRLGSALAPVSNWLARAPGMGWLADTLLGIDRRRPLPHFHRDHFRRWFRRRRPRQPAPRGIVVLLDDCLTCYCDPLVPRAAVHVLEAAGYEVRLARIACCARPAISKGLLTHAKRLAEENIRRLAPLVAEGVSIVGCEPSCVSALADDYLDLVPGKLTSAIASATYLVESFLVNQGIRLALRPHAATALVHGHCHQKALVGTQDTARLLAQIDGLKVDTLDSGCCGMAGSFGYEHYDLSMKIGDRVLFPAVRRNHEAIIAAPGFSCRHQIEHGTGRHAHHPIEIVANNLVK